MEHDVHRNERDALFRAHATAVLGRDDAELARTHRLIYPEHYLAHHTYMLGLFTTCVYHRFGDQLDWNELGDFIDHLRRTSPDLPPLKAEALIRSRYDEAPLYFEVPASEHYRLFIAISRLAIGPDRNEAELTELCDEIESFGRDFAKAMYTTLPALGFERPEPEETP